MFLSIGFIRCGGRPFDDAHRRVAKGKMRRVEATVSRSPGTRPIFGAAQGDVAGSFESTDRDAGLVQQHQHQTDAEIDRRNVCRRRLIVDGDASLEDDQRRRIPNGSSRR